VEKDIILRRFLTALPVRMEAARQGAEFHSVLIEADDQTGKAISVRRYAITDSGEPA
jgi:hypothetical protein